MQLRKKGVQRNELNKKSEKQSDELNFKNSCVYGVR